MASSQSQPGYEALRQNQERVILTIRNNLDAVAYFLEDKKIIRLSIYNQITDIGSSEDTLAKIVYQELMNQAEEDDEKYKKFVEYLRNNTDSKRTVTKLDRTYDKQLKKIKNEGN